MDDWHRRLGQAVSVAPLTGRPGGPSDGIETANAPPLANPASLCPGPRPRRRLRKTETGPGLRVGPEEPRPPLRRDPQFRRGARAVPVLLGPFQGDTSG